MRTFKICFDVYSGGSEDYMVKHVIGSYYKVEDGILNVYSENRSIPKFSCKSWLYVEETNE